MNDNPTAFVKSLVIVWIGLAMATGAGFGVARAQTASEANPALYDGETLVTAAG